MKISPILILGLSLLTIQVFSQVANSYAPDFAQLDYENRKEFNIKQVNIVGAERRDDNAIKSITGLREGGVVTIPSEELSNAMNKLYRLRLFSSVEIVLDSLIENDVYLTILLKEQPVLSGFKFENIKKGKQEKLIEALGETLKSRRNRYS